MRDIDASPAYSQGNEAEFRREVNKGVDACYSREKDVFVSMDQRACIQSADGNWWRLEVSNAGALVITGVTP